MAPQTQFFSAPNPDGNGTHRIAYYDWGNPDSQNIALCVHGLTRNARDFDFLAEALVNKGYRVLALSMAGRGESERFENPMHYHYGTYVADCIAFMDNFHLRNVDWVGTSMGGIIGMMLQAANTKRIRKLVLNDIGSLLTKEALQRIYAYVASMPQHFASLSEAEGYYRKNFAPWGITDEAVWQHFLAHSVRETADGRVEVLCDPSIAAPLRATTHNFTEVADVNLAEIWLKIQIPTLILRGETSDILMPFTVDAMKSTNPKASSITVAGCGHAPALATPEQIALITDWLQTKHAMVF